MEIFFFFALSFVFHISISSSTLIQTLPLFNSFGVQHTVTLYMGTNRTPFRMILDTGSTWLWVASNQCPSCTQMGLGNVYDCKGECKIIDESLNPISYGTGEMDGVLTTDVIAIEKNGIQMKGVRFLQARRVDDMNRFRADGIFGLGPDSHEYMTQLKESGLIEESIFSIYLSGKECSTSSKLILGGIDSNLYNGELIWAKRRHPRYWSVGCQSVLISKGSQKQDLNFFSVSALIDSGTSDLAFSKDQTMKIVDGFNELGLDCSVKKNEGKIYQVYCGSMKEEDYPTLVFRIELGGGKTTELEITPKLYLDTCNWKFTTTECRLFIIVSPLSSDMIILGKPFFTQYYTAFDYKRKRIGFAESVGVKEIGLSYEWQIKLRLLLPLFVFFLLLGLIPVGVQKYMESSKLKFLDFLGNINKGSKINFEGSLLKESYSDVSTIEIELPVDLERVEEEKE